MGIGIKRTIFGPAKTTCSKCHKEVNKNEDGSWRCPCRNWAEY